MPDWQNYLTAGERVVLDAAELSMAEAKRMRAALMNRAKQRKHRAIKRLEE